MLAIQLIFDVYNTVSYFADCPAPWRKTLPLHQLLMRPNVFMKTIREWTIWLCVDFAPYE